MIVQVFAFAGVAALGIEPYNKKTAAEWFSRGDQERPVEQGRQPELKAGTSHGGYRCVLNSMPAVGLRRLYRIGRNVSIVTGSCPATVLLSPTGLQRTMWIFTARVSSVSSSLSRPSALRETGRRLSSLAQHGSIRQASAKLGIPRTTLQYWVDGLGLEVPVTRSRS